MKLASHLGRYQKRERAKHVQNYSSSDLAAILGAAMPGELGANHDWWARLVEATMTGGLGVWGKRDTWARL